VPHPKLYHSASLLDAAGRTLSTGEVLLLPELPTMAIYRVSQSPKKEDLPILTEVAFLLLSHESKKIPVVRAEINHADTDEGERMDCPFLRLEFPYKQP
jgi:hypothetical protein